MELLAIFLGIGLAISREQLPDDGGGPPPVLDADYLGPDYLGPDYLGADYF